MVDTIYIEQAVSDLPRSREILARYPSAQQIEIEKYGEVFNPHAQNFRMQKHNPALILAAKQNKKVLSTPIQYETGGGANYYFSHMLNCLYDCRYCFLQGMYRSANYLLFVNFEDFFEEIKSLDKKHENDDKQAWFFSGYDCDSLALEPITKFADYFLSQFESLSNSVLELRTKSTQIRSLLDRPALSNVVVAYSLSPQEVAAAIEKGAPSLDKRLSALKKLQNHGWRVGVRFDPVIWHKDYQSHYAELIKRVFTTLDPSAIDSVTLGGFRLPKGYYKTMRNLYPDHALFSAGLSEQQGLIAYRPEIEQEVFEFLSDRISPYINDEKLYVYPTNEKDTS
ncbi:MAG: hypothetical protein KTR16_14365 [Acidiferrobacterales bacterium]|nr:hypothetical protein [Acidiferrobacterales bacterium]